MKKRVLALLFALLLLCGCADQVQPASVIQPVTFYYRTAQTDYDSEDGVIRAEVQDLGDGSFTDLQIFAKYFEGPVSRDLVSPISQDTKLAAVRRNGSRLDLYLIQDVNSPAELDHTLTYACLVKTGLALEGVNKVRIIINSPSGSDESDTIYTDNSFLLYDNGDAPNTTGITLYYADESGRFLLPEKRTVPQMSDEELASYVLKLLCSPPQSGGMQSPLPPGTALMENPIVRNGVCTVDFYPEFCENAPVGEQAQALAILSVVNTLCKLESINQVQIYVSGWQVEPGYDSDYRYLDLSAPWTSDSSVIGPVREELGEFAGVLCLPGQRENLLHRLTVRARAKGGISREEALLQLLAERTAQNGFSAPFSDSPSILSVTMVQGVCTVKLGAGSLPVEGRERALSVKSIAATLCSLPEVASVMIYEDGKSVSEEPLFSQESWFLESQSGE